MSANQQPEQPEQEASTSPAQAAPQAAAWIANCEWLFIFWMLYCFSIGPMYHMWFLGKYTSTGYFWVAVFYEPLWRLAQIIPPLGYWLDGYLAWWLLG